MGSLENYESFVAQAAELADQAIHSGKSDAQCARMASMARLFASLAMVEHQIAVADKTQRTIEGWGRRIAMCERMLLIQEGESKMPDPFKEGEL